MGIIAGAISRGLSLFKLNKATAIESHVLEGETFYARSKDIRKGTLKNRGQYQTGGWGSGTVNGWNYYAINALPEGAYFSNGQSWAPEARVSQDTVHNAFGGYHGAWKGVSYGDAVAIPRGIHDGNGYVSIDGGNKGAWGTSLNPGGSVAVPRGWHNGSGYVTARAINSTDIINSVKSGSYGGNSYSDRVDVGSDKYILGLTYADLRGYPGDGTVVAGEWYEFTFPDYHTVKFSGKHVPSFNYVYIQL